MHDQQLNVTVCNKGFTLQLTQNCSDVIKRKKRDEKNKERKRKANEIAFARAYSQNESYQSFVYSFHKPCLQKVIPVVLCDFLLWTSFREPKSSDNCFRLQKCWNCLLSHCQKQPCINCTARKHEKVIKSKGKATAHTWLMGKWHYDGDTKCTGFFLNVNWGWALILLFKLRAATWLSTRSTEQYLLNHVKVMDKSQIPITHLVEILPMLLTRYMPFEAATIIFPRP